MTTDGGGRSGQFFVVLAVLSGLIGVLAAWQIFMGSGSHGTLAGRATTQDNTYKGSAKSEGSVGNAGAAGGIGRQNGGPARPPSVPSNSALTVTIGPVQLLYPGLERRVPVRVANPFDFDIRITRFDVASAGTSRCPAGFLSVGRRPADGPAIDANGFVDTYTTIGLNASAPDSCQLERFHFSVTVTAAKS